MIYVVEDDNGIREIEIYSLQSAGYDAKGFSTGKEFFNALEKEKPALVLLDVMLPDQDGITILQKLKKSADTKDIPIIVASAKGTEYDKVVGLDAGADDYLAKPFGMMEMLSRVRAVLRRSQTAHPDELAVNNITIRLPQHEVSVDGEPIELTLKEYNMLVLFLSHPKIVFTREQLLNQIWGTEYDGETRTVDVHIRTLRQKLGEAGNHIQTVRGVGYRYEDES